MLTCTPTLAVPGTIAKHTQTIMTKLCRTYARILTDTINNAQGWVKNRVPVYKQHRLMAQELGNWHAQPNTPKVLSEYVKTLRIIEARDQNFKRYATVLLILIYLGTLEKSLTNSQEAHTRIKSRIQENPHSIPLYAFLESLRMIHLQPETNLGSATAILDWLKRTTPIHKKVAPPTHPMIHAAYQDIEDILDANKHEAMTDNRALAYYFFALSIEDTVQILTKKASQSRNQEQAAALQAEAKHLHTKVVRYFYIAAKKNIAHAALFAGYEELLLNREQVADIFFSTAVTAIEPYPHVPALVDLSLITKHDYEQQRNTLLNKIQQDINKLYE